MAALNAVAFTILAVTLLGGGFGLTDEEVENIDPIVAKIIGQLTEKIGQLNEDIGDLKEEVVELKETMKTQDTEIKRLSAVVSRHEEAVNSDNRKWKPEVLESEMVQNATIEERVSLLEEQVVDLQDDITVIVGDVVDLDEDVDFLFDEQVIQDERLFSLEQTTLGILGDVDNLQETTVELDFRVTVLEENGGDDGNSSVAELELRVETLEETAADHETRLTTAEMNIEALETTSSDQEVRLSAAEENIQGLQATDMNHDARLSALEENGGGGGSDNGTIAFHSTLTSYSSIPVGSAVIFNEVLLNEGEGYDSTTGVFTVPSGGDGIYYFSMFLLVDLGERGLFDITLNDDVICSTYPDHENSGAGDYAPGSCSAVVNVAEGDEVQVVLRSSNDNTPLQGSTAYLFNGFNGFRI